MNNQNRKQDPSSLPQQEKEEDCKHSSVRYDDGYNLQDKTLAAGVIAVAASKTRYSSGNGWEFGGLKTILFKGMEGQGA
jgi:hypothetical protein